MSTSGKTVAGIRFGPFLLDTESRRLMRDGRRVPITPIELKLLETLLRNRDRVLTGDDLRLLVWADDPSSGVAPAQDVNALYVAIRKLRRSLGDEGEWIVNIPKVGYSFSEDVKVEGGLANEIDGHGSTFVGRTAELERLKGLISKSQLITLTGPPGIGKSRLAAELVDRVRDEFPSASYFVKLAPIENESLVAGAVLSTLGLKESAERTELETICDDLKGKKSLIILDNCEHLIDACSDVVDKLIRTLPDLRLVATSLEPLMLQGETVLPVLPLGLPDAAGEKNVNGHEQGDAVQLFIKLAKQHRSDIELEREHLHRVGDLCRQLEGLPLAIELAAVQVGAYTVDQIIEAMADRFRLLRRRGGENLRHRTLEDAVDWSFSLLAEEERLLLQRLSVFTGGWTVESARAVCAGDGVDEHEVIHLLAQLVRRSLIHLNSKTQRYTMLETIRLFARRCLRDSDEEARIISSHFSYFLDLAEKAFEAGPDIEWLERTKTEYDNLRSVLDRSIRQGRDIETGLKMCGALPKFWFNFGQIREAKYWSRLAMDADPGVYKYASAKALVTAGFYFGQFAAAGEDPEVGRSYLERSITIWRELGAKKEEAFTLVHYAFLLYRLGRPEKAKEAAQESLDISSAAGDHANIARSANNLALAFLEMGEEAQARSVFEVALSAARLARDQYLEGMSLYYLGEMDLRSGDLEAATSKLGRGLELFQSIGNRPLAARSLLLQGEAAAHAQDYHRSLELEQAALREFCEIEDQQGIASSLEAIACTMALDGSQPGQFLMLTSAASEIRRRSKLKLVTRRKELLDRLAKKAKSSLGKSAAGAAVERGQTMTVDEATEIALSTE